MVRGHGYVRTDLLVFVRDALERVCRNGRVKPL